MIIHSFVYQINSEITCSFINEYANQEELNFKSDQQPLKNNDRDMKQLCLIVDLSKICGKR